jgi:hypothetical protein
MTRLSKHDTQELEPDYNVSKSNLQNAVNDLIRKHGLNGSATIDQIPGGYGGITGTTNVPNQVEIRVQRKEISSDSLAANIPTHMRMMQNA